MIPKRRAENRRFAVSAMIALPVTVALLFLMTRLILPGEKDPIVTRMIRNIELQRAVLTPEPDRVPIFEQPLPTRARPPVIEPDSTAEASSPAQKPDQNQDAPSDEGTAKDEPARTVDWAAELRRLTQESDEEAFKRWLLEQGHERYTTIMQGPLPITNSVRAELPSTQEDITGYMNTYGDKEIKVSEYCVAQTTVSARLDISDFAEKIPMRVMCKSPSTKIEFPFSRDYLE